MDPYLCCLFQICCPPLVQFDNLVALRMKKGTDWYMLGLTRAAARKRVKQDLEIAAAFKGQHELLRAMLAA